MSTTASGITSRGNCVLRTTDSWATIEPTAITVASWKKPNSTMLNSSRTGYSLHALAEVERLREDEEQHAEQQQRTGERPQVAERGAEVAAPELGDRDQVQQVGGTPPAAAERRRAADLAQLEARVAHGSSVGLHVGVDASRCPCHRCGAVDDEVEQPQLVQRDVALLAAARDEAVHEVAARREPVLDRRPRSARARRSATDVGLARRRASASRLKPKIVLPVRVDEVDGEHRRRRGRGAPRARSARAIGSPCSTVVDPLAAGVLEPGVDGPRR